MATYKVPVLVTFAWQQPVLSRLASPPAGVKGHRYLVIATGSGAWAGKENYIAEYNGSSWDFITPTAGMFTYSVADDWFLHFNGSAWVVLNNEYVQQSLATAANDFLVASGAGTFVKKTLAETKTILGATGIDFLVAQVYS